MRPLRSTILLLLSFVFIEETSFAQNDTILIQKTIGQFFEGMAKLDTNLMRACITKNARLESTGKKVSENVIQIEFNDYFSLIAETIDRPDMVIYEERIHNYTILINKGLAMAWTPYTFYLKGTFSHCGVNLFTLLKIDGKWKINSIIDTESKEDCDLNAK